jgi:ribulose-5-phosphate 4-epimerase/fuculose-1-phosphate aldolase
MDRRFKNITKRRELKFLMSFSSDSENELIADLVSANRILYNRGIVDGFGHVSARSSLNKDRFLIARSMAPALVKKEDILTVDLNGRVCDDARSSYLERFIHSEIYRVRPDVMAIVHSHSVAVLPFTVVQDVQLRPICHMCGFIRHNAPVFEIREEAGEASDLLIRDRQLGEALARILGPNALVLMRGHGSTVVGNSIKQAVFRAVYTELNAVLQANAMRMGAATFLTEKEADAAAATNDGQIDRPWQLWLLEAAKENGI